MTSSASATPRRHVTWGRSFVVLAEFPDNNEGTRQANAHMAGHPGVGVLEVSNGAVILASNTDKASRSGRYAECSARAAVA